MARPELFMRTPNDDIITFDTLDQAEEWLQEGIDHIRGFREAHQKRRHDAVLADLKRHVEHNGRG